MDRTSSHHLPAVVILLAVVRTLTLLRAKISWRVVSISSPSRLDLFCKLRFIDPRPRRWSLSTNQLVRGPRFLAWSVALIYLLVGPAYRLSLMGAFSGRRSSLRFRPCLDCADRYSASNKNFPANSWLEFHASMSIVAYGVPAPACIAGVMYLVQERQLKTRQICIPSFIIFRPLKTISSRDHAPALVGLRTLHRRSGQWLFLSASHCQACRLFLQLRLIFCMARSWQGRYLRWFAPRRVAALCIVGFSAALTLLWGITFTAQMHSLP